MTASASTAVSPENGRARLLSGSKWHLLGFGFVLASHFAIVPVVISKIGLSAFGAGGLLLAAFAPLTLVGTVLGQATVRETAHNLAANDIAKAGQSLTAILLLCLAGCLGVAALAASISPWALAAVGRDVAGMIDGTAVAITFAGWAAQQFSLVLQSVMLAAQRYAFVAIASGLSAIATMAATIGLVIATPSTSGYLAGTALAFGLTLLVWAITCHVALPGLWTRERVSRSQFKAIAHFCGWQACTNFVGVLGQQMDRYVLGALTSLAVVGQYNVAMRLQEVAHMGVLKACEVLFPHFRVTLGDPVRQRLAVFLRSSWALNTVAACALAPLVPLAEPLLQLWVGPEAAHGATPMLQMLAAAGIFGAASNVYSFHAMATGHAVRLAGLSTVHAALAIVMTVALISSFGASAAGGGYLLANVVRVPLVLMLSRRYFDRSVSWGALAGCVLPPLLAGLVIAALWTWLAALYPQSWLSLFAAYAVVALSALAGSVVATLLTRHGRAMLARSWQTSSELVGPRS